ncbi:MAG TPA: lysophospholipid acyltransferase family protein [Terriglobales bacterium]
MNAIARTPSPPKADAPWRKYTLKQHIQLGLITWSAYWVIRILGPSIRFSVSLEEGSIEEADLGATIFAFWHNCMIPAMYLFRDMQVRVMSSDSFDGEYTGRIMQKFGFVKVRGSSTRGAVRALLGMRRALEQGAAVAFTIDGPKGPRYMAKPGPVALARSTGAPMVVFHIAMQRAWVLRTWDGTMIPKPFTRALVRISRKIVVPTDASDQEMEFSHKELQSALDRVREFCEAHISEAGTPQFPPFRGKFATSARLPVTSPP